MHQKDLVQLRGRPAQGLLAAFLQPKIVAMSGIPAAARFLGQCVLGGLAAAFVAVAIKPELLGARSTASSPVAPGPASYADAVAATAPAVVNIYTTRRASAAPWLDFGEAQHGYPTESAANSPQRIEDSLGSGVLLAEGYLLTNEHVISEAQSIHVALNDGRVTEAALVGTDPDTDLALLQVELDGLPYIQLGRSDTIRIGDVVLAIGNPFGIGQTVTQGIVSATGRSQLGLSLFENFIQTDASINPGNSGGALINTRGELIGINTAMFSRDDSEGIGFAIPVNLARGVMQQLIENGRVLRGWLGVDARDLRQDGIPDHAAMEGVLVTHVFPDGPASLAGLRAGDIVRQVNARPVNSWQELLNEVARVPPGTSVQVRATRAGEEFEVVATVAERPALPGRKS
jgi:serine peptidase DegS